LRITDHFAGMVVSGEMNGRRLSLLLDRLKPGVTEVVVHPGEADAQTHMAYRHWGYRWSTELQALTHPPEAGAETDGSFTLISYHQFIAMGASGRGRSEAC
jgi:hypothetical protein